MSGLPIEQALRSDTIVVVLTQTLFGKVAIFRFVILAALFVLLFALPTQGRARAGAIGLLTGLLLVTIAASGHAAAERGSGRIAHLFIDGVHLIAAGAWLGALIPLAVTLSCGLRDDRDSQRLAMQAVNRFSILGIVCMALLLLSGVLNALYTVNPISAALHTHYGRLLALKIGLFLVIVAIAAVNRVVLTPTLSAAPRDQRSMRAGKLLKWNALVELALGLTIVAIVAILGITVPASHPMGNETVRAPSRFLNSGSVPRSEIH